MADIHGKKVKLFCLNSNPVLGQEIADYMGISLAECNISRFSDGEVNINIAETVRGHNVFVIQTTSFPVNEHYMELLIMIDALKRASAKTINVIMPYYGYSRQDRKALSRQPILRETRCAFINSCWSYKSCFYGFTCSANSRFLWYSNR